MTIQRIKFNTSIVNNNNLEKKIFYILASFFAVGIAFYLYLVSHAIFNIIERKNIESDIRNLSGEISTIQIEYITLSKKIDYSLAESLGFKEAKDVYFASRKTSVGALIKNSNEL